MTLSVTQLPAIPRSTPQAAPRELTAGAPAGGADATPLLKGLPDDSCPCPHWGYVLEGRVTFRFADRDEVFEAGDAFYLPPGHIPIVQAGAAYVQFSPSEDLRAVSETMARNMQAMQTA